VQAKAKAAQMEALKCREKLRMSQKEAWLWKENEPQDGPAVMETVETAEKNGTPGSTLFCFVPVVFHDVKESL
jgi:hypothetical protein